MDRPDPRANLVFLADNLKSRGRLGLRLVAGGPADLERLLAFFNPAPDFSRLEDLSRNMRQCKKCPLHEGRRKVVVGQGPSPARAMFIGEAPGEKEDEKGLPFVGPAGMLLSRMLAAVGLKREQVYITNIVKCRPPHNRDPLPEEAAACRPFLEAQVRAVQPKVICALGRPAAQSLLDTKAPISALRGNWQTFGQVRLLPTFHPAFLLRQPERKAEAYRDLKALAHELGLGPAQEAGK